MTDGCGGYLSVSLNSFLSHFFLCQYVTTGFPLQLLQTEITFTEVRVLFYPI